MTVHMPLVRTAAVYDGSVEFSVAAHATSGMAITVTMSGGYDETLAAVLTMHRGAVGFFPAPWTSTFDDGPTFTPAEFAIAFEADPDVFTEMSSSVAKYGLRPPTWIVIEGVDVTTAEASVGLYLTSEDLSNYQYATGDPTATYEDLKSRCSMVNGSCLRSMSEPR